MRVGEIGGRRGGEGREGLFTIQYRDKRRARRSSHGWVASFVYTFSELMRSRELAFRVLLHY